MAKRRAPKVVKRRRRPLLKLVVALAICGLVFGATAVATLWLIETTQLLSTRPPAGETPEDFDADERRALEEIVEQGAAKTP